MVKFHDERLKPCRNCGHNPVVAHWGKGSGHSKYRVVCDDPNLSESCRLGALLSLSPDLDEAILRWNFIQSIPWKRDFDTCKWVKEHYSELKDVHSMTATLLTWACTYCNTVDNPFANELARRCGREEEFRSGDDEKKRKLFFEIVLSDLKGGVTLWMN